MPTPKTWTVDVELVGNKIKMPLLTGTLNTGDKVEWKITGAKGCTLDIDLSKHRSGVINMKIPTTGPPDPFSVFQIITGPTPTHPPPGPDIQTASYSLKLTSPASPSPASLSTAPLVATASPEPNLVIDTSGGPVMGLYPQGPGKGEGETPDHP